MRINATTRPSASENKTESRAIRTVTCSPRSKKAIERGITLQS